MVSLTFLSLGYLLFFSLSSHIVNPVMDALELLSVKSGPDYNKVPVNIYNPVDAPTLPTSISDMPTPATGEPADAVPERETVKASTINFPRVGMKYAELSVPEVDIVADVYYGDGKNELKNGVGQYAGSSFPGEGSTILIAGHNTKHFYNFKNATVGMKVYISVNYGLYTYEITDMKVYRHNDPDAWDLNLPEETLIMYTCYPFDTFGLTPQRMFIYAKLISGPMVVNE